ncbi:MAG: aldo/keto reductase [Pseudomonadota bacterium]
MMTRREYLKLMLAAGAAMSIPKGLALADDQPMNLIRRAIPSTGEQLPAIGLGSSATFSRHAGAGEREALGQVLKTLVKKGGSVFDTAPLYGASEAVAGDLARQMEIADQLFWATKLNVAGWGGGEANPDEARAQLKNSFEHFGGSPIDLIQVHNLGDVPTQLGLLKELKAEERVRYIGVTTTFPRQYEQLEKVMQREPLDFVGIDYAIDNRTMEERILPLAKDKGIGVLVYAPFGRDRLWGKVSGRQLPDWAADFGAHSWAQFFLKFVLAHPVVTAATPATSQAKHMADNMGATYGRLPDEEQRQRMVALIESL